MTQHVFAFFSWWNKGYYKLINSQILIENSCFVLYSHTTHRFTFHTGVLAYAHKPKLCHCLLNVFSIIFRASLWHHIPQMPLFTRSHLAVIGGMYFVHGDQINYEKNYSSPCQRRVEVRQINHLWGVDKTLALAMVYFGNYILTTSRTEFR